MSRPLKMLSAIGFILWLLLPFIVWLSRKHVRGLQNRVAIPFLASVLLGSLLYIGAVWLAGAEIERALYKFDLDGDRQFSETEMTADAQAAMRRYSNDTGRTFASLIAAPTTLVLTTAWFLFLALAESLWRRIRRASGPKLA